MPFYSNIPTVLAQQDFNDKHADMLAAAREGATNLVYDPMFDEMVSKEEFKRRRDTYKVWADDWTANYKALPEWRSLVKGLK